MKILALDIGDVWTGLALSDASGILARPLTTVSTTQLFKEIALLIEKHQLTVIVVGYPTTLRATISQQTKKVDAVLQELTTQFPTITFKKWDERLTSKYASQLKKTRTKEDKIQSHSIAAAFILQTYLDFHAQESFE